MACSVCGKDKPNYAGGKCKECYRVGWLKTDKGKASIKNAFAREVAKRREELTELNELEIGLVLDQQDKKKDPQKLSREFMESIIRGKKVSQE